MPFELTDEQKMLRQTVRRLAEEKIGPRAAEIDAQCEYPWDMFELIRQNGLLAVAVPEAYGGPGADMVSFCIVVEELNRVCASTGCIPMNQELGLVPILLAGTEEQKRKYLPGAVTGEHIFAFTLTEPAAGSDPASMKTRARGEGDAYVLEGQKCFCSNGGIADVYVVFAITQPGRGNKGIGALIVEKGAPGFRVGRVEKKMGIHGSQTAELFFEDCRLPKQNLLGQEDQGFKIAMLTLDKTRPMVGAQAVGIAQGALDYALNYAKQRVQFGQPIAEFQAIQFMLADMATEIEAARLLVYKACEVVDQNLPEMAQYGAMAKYYASDIAMKVTIDAVQILGGYGYVQDHPVERMMRDAKITQIYEGTNQIQRLVVARSLLGRY